MKINKHILLIGMVMILSACAASCGKAQPDAAENEAVTEASVPSEERETSLSETDENSDKAELD